MNSSYLIPGPTLMSPAVLGAYANQMGSSDLDEAFWDDYFLLEKVLQKSLCTESSVAIQSGEGMVGLWGALKSTIRRDDTVVCAANGVFGQGFVEMAKSLGANVCPILGNWRSQLDVTRLIEEIKERDPKLVILVHCETPTGLLNSLEGIGEAVKKHTTDGLFLVDFVSSAFGAPLDVDGLGIDMGLLAPQKAMSGPPALSFTTVSEKAWKRINYVGYRGYDALSPFYCLENTSPPMLPYTHNWHAIRACIAACQDINDMGGVSKSIERHAEVAAFCRKEIKNLGLQLYCCNNKAASPTVTSVEIPAYCTWAELDHELRKENVYFGGSYGPLSGKVFRIGHMGTQSNKKIVSHAIGALRRVLHKLRP